MLDKAVLRPAYSRILPRPQALRYSPTVLGVTHIGALQWTHESSNTGVLAVPGADSAAPSLVSGQIGYKLPTGRSAALAWSPADPTRTCLTER